MFSIHYPFLFSKNSTTICIEHTKKICFLSLLTHPLPLTDSYLTPCSLSSYFIREDIPQPNNKVGGIKSIQSHSPHYLFYPQPFISCFSTGW